MSDQSLSTYEIVKYISIPICSILNSKSVVYIKYIIKYIKYVYTHIYIRIFKGIIENEKNVTDL